MTKNQVIGGAILSTIPLGMLAWAIMTDMVGELLVGLGVAALIIFVMSAGTWFLSRER